MGLFGVPGVAFFYGIRCRLLSVLAEARESDWWDGVFFDPDGGLFGFSTCQPRPCQILCKPAVGQLALPQQV